MISRPYAKICNVGKLTQEIIDSGKPVYPEVGARFYGCLGTSIDTNVLLFDDITQGEIDSIDAIVSAHVVLTLAEAKVNKKSALQEDANAVLVLQGYYLDVQQSFQAMYSDSSRLRPNRETYLRPYNDWVNQINEEIKVKQALVDTKTTIEDVNAVSLDTSTLIAADPKITVAGAMAITDTQSLETFLNANAEVVDTPSGVHGPFYLMQELVNRRELFGDTENPLYYAGQNQAILGANGILQDHANRIILEETIHGKTGWHRQDVKRATYKRPIDLLIYYGWINSFNSADNGWDNEKVARDMAKYGLIILGDGIENPSHGDYANTQVVIPRVKLYNTSALIFGYVSANQALADFKTKVDQWNTLGVHGIFMDEAGYDYGKTRAEFNERVDYIHGKTSARVAFANAWNTDHVLGTTNDVSYPNTTYNALLTASKLNTDDWVLLESFPVNTTAYSGNAGYESRTDWVVRGTKALSLRATYNVNFAAVGIINNDNASGDNLFKFLFISSMEWSLEASGSSDTSYGASSAAVKFWTRPDVKDMGIIWTLNASVQQDTGDADIYYRYSEMARMLLDFSTGAQTSSITKW